MKINLSLFYHLLLAKVPPFLPFELSVRLILPFEISFPWNLLNDNPTKYKKIKKNFNINSNTFIKTEFCYWNKGGWTITPWILPSNLFLAVNPKITYVEADVQFKGKTETFILGEPRLKSALKM